MSSRRLASTRGCASSSSASISRVSSSSFSACSFRWRSRSRARCFAVVMSHAAGLSGMPATGHVSSAATSASCASSSARPTSRTIRATPAMIFADSMRKTASIALCVGLGGHAARAEPLQATARNQRLPKTVPLTPLFVSAGSSRETPDRAGEGRAVARDVFRDRSRGFIARRSPSSPRRTCPSTCRTSARRTSCRAAS